MVQDRTIVTMAANSKSNMTYRAALFSMTLNDHLTHIWRSRQYSTHLS